MMTTRCNRAAAGVCRSIFFINYYVCKLKFFDVDQKKFYISVDYIKKFYTYYTQETFSQKKFEEKKYCYNIFSLILDHLLL
jgi:hypothetical protein